MEKLSAFLLQQADLKENSYNEFRRISEENGRNIAAVILSHSSINPQKLYGAIAAMKNLEFADLEKYPCDSSILCKTLRDEYLKLGAIPWRKNGDITFIATSEITPALQNWAENNYGANHKFAIATPFDISGSVSNIFANDNDYDAREKLYEMNPECSAKYPVSTKNLLCFLTIVLAALALAVKFPVKTMAIAFVVTSVFYTVTMLFKSLLLIIGYFVGKNAEKNSFKITAQNSALPVYTILVPLYKEEKTLARLKESLLALDYPKEKLDVKLIVEADDEITISAIKKLRPPRSFEIIKVPYSEPRTKPKACNYALRFARGEFVTIYDAEDSPEPDQLKKVLYKFQNSDAKLACVQARLNYFNHSENLLTRMFAMEYSVLFDFMLFGLEKIGIPIPLGGTSNHFRTETLRELYAWDPYNVTEDADLGLRISQKGWRCGMVWSRTFEEAPLSLWAWIKQRTRWIKGHMQTYLVHMRQPLVLYRKIGLLGFAGMQFFFGAPTLIFLISPIMWLVWGLFMTGIFSFNIAMPHWFDVMVEFSIAALYFGLASQVLFALAAVSRNKWRGMVAYSFIFPFYWALHSVASFRALWQLFKCPHYWEKTTHGLTKIIGRA